MKFTVTPPLMQGNGYRYADLLDEQGQRIATVSTQLRGDDLTALIVALAAAGTNSHDALVAALADMVQAFDDGRFLGPYGPVLTNCRAALALARGEAQS